MCVYIYLFTPKYSIGKKLRLGETTSPKSKSVVTVIQAYEQQNKERCSMIPKLEFIISLQIKNIGE